MLKKDSYICVIFKNKPVVYMPLLYQDILQLTPL